MPELTANFNSVKAYKEFVRNQLSSQTIALECKQAECLSDTETGALESAKERDNHV
jgi:hypothetical protein